jgi:hypothetical protein
MDVVVYNGRLYAAPVLVVVVGWGGSICTTALVGDGLDRGVLSLTVYNGELCGGAGRGVFRVYKAWVFKRRCCELDVGCGYPWRGLFVSCGFLLIGDSLYDSIGRWDGRRFYADVDAGGYDFAEFGEYIYASVRWRALSVPRWYSVGRYWGGGMWSLAVYKGKLFMGYNNGGRGTVLAICVGCLSLKCLIRF